MPLQSNLKKIANQLEAMTDDSKFQLFSSEFVMLFRPDQFKELRPLSGMNLNERATKGHPDSFSSYKDGIAVLEVCGILDKSGVINNLKTKTLTRLRNDLKNANITYLCLVLKAFAEGGDKPTYPLKLEILEIAKKLFPLDDSDICIINGFDLASELAYNLKYTRLLRTYFRNVVPFPTPFSDLENALPSRQFWAFPAMDDFLNGNISIPGEYLPKALEILDNSFKLLVTGSGASGKTVLAFAIGFHYVQRQYDVVYIDLKDYPNADSIDKAFEFLMDNPHPELLVIFDNAHSNTHLTNRFSELITLQHSNKFKILFLSRPQQEEKSGINLSFKSKFLLNRGREITLKVTSEFFASVTTFLKTRGIIFLGETPSTFLRLCDRFGQDLFLFSFLASNSKEVNLEDINPNNDIAWKLVRERYLDRYRGGDKKQFLDRFIHLCVLFSIDYAPLSTCFHKDNPLESIFSEEINDGIVYKSPTDRYSLAHPSLGVMLVHHFSRETNRSAEEIAANSILQSIMLEADFFEALNDQGTYRKNRLYPLIFANDEFIKQMVFAGTILPSRFLSTVNFSIRGFMRRYYDLLFTNISATSNALKNSDINTIMAFLKEASLRGSALLENVLLAIVSMKVPISIELEKSPPHDLASFLQKIERYCQETRFKNSTTRALSDVHSYFIKVLTEKTGNKSYFNLLTKSLYSLGYVFAFIRYIKNKNQEFFEAVLFELLKQSNRASLISKGFANPPEFFVSFISSCENLKSFRREQLVPDLNQPEVLRLLNSFWERWSMDGILAFLRFWAECSCDKCHDYLKNCIHTLFDPSYCEQIADCISATSIQVLIGFLDYARQQSLDISFLRDNFTHEPFIRKLQDKIKKLPVRQKEMHLTKMAQTGEIGRIICSKLGQNILSVKGHHLPSHFVNITDIIQFIEEIKGKPQSEIDEILSFGKIKGAFSKSFSTLSFHFKNGPCLPETKVHTEILSQIVGLLRRLLPLNTVYAIEIINICDQNIPIITNIILSEHVDKVQAFLSFLDDILPEGKALSDSLLSCLHDQKCADRLCLNGFEKSASYLYSLLKYLVDRDRFLFDFMMNDLLSKWFGRLCKTCANSTPYQLLPFLEFLDKFENANFVRSEMILSAISKDSKLLGFFKYRYGVATEIHRKGFDSYIRKFHNSIASIIST